MDKVTRQFRLQQWAEALRDHKESGLTVMEWCRLHNVSKYQFYYRQREVRKHAAQFLALQPVQADKPAFVEVSHALRSQPAAPDTDPVLSRVTACIRAGNADIFVSDETSEELLAKILRAVRSC
jgi:hypothetical protein